MMAKKLKLTFERGGVVYAVLNEKDAPNMVAQFCATLPRTDDMLHGRYAGPAMFINTGLENVTPENLVGRKWVGMITVTLGIRSMQCICSTATAVKLRARTMRFIWPRLRTSISRCLRRSAIGYGATALRR